MNISSIFVILSKNKIKKENKGSYRKHFLVDVTYIGYLPCRWYSGGFLDKWKCAKPKKHTKTLSPQYASQREKKKKHCFKYIHVSLSVSKTPNTLVRTDIMVGINYYMKKVNIQRWSNDHH